MIVEYEEMFENSDKSKDDESEIKMNATDGNTKAKMKKTCGKTWKPCKFINEDLKQKLEVNWRNMWRNIDAKNGFNALNVLISFTK